MEERKLNLDAPFLSVRRILTKLEYSSDPEVKETNEKTAMAPLSCPNTDNQTPVCLPGQSFDHLTEPASVPFVWEQTPGMPKNTTESELVEEEPIKKTGLNKEEEEDDEAYSDAIHTGSSNGYFSMNCSSSGVSESDKHGEKSGTLDGEIPEYRRLVMARFLPAAKAMALKQQEQKLPQNHQICSPAQKTKQQMILNREEALALPDRRTSIRRHELAMAVSSHYEEDEEESEGDDYDYITHSNISKKGWGFIPRLCVKNSTSFLDPIPSLRVKICQDLQKPGKIIQPNPTNWINKQNRSSWIVNDSSEPVTPSWSSRRLSGFISPYRYGSSRSSLSESGCLGPEKGEFFRVNQSQRGTSRSQELYPRRTRELLDLSRSVSKSQEIRTVRQLTPRTPSRMQRSCSIQDVKLLEEEVKKRRSSSRRSGNLETSPVATPPLPKTPSESWLVRTLTPRNSISSRPKLLSETPPRQSTKWETIVKTSYIHHDHVRYSEELIVHPSRQHKT